ncbi:MAG: hypothetical protein HW390_1264 [Candidatus Brocadiaceae bacterium]|nr:hypothetical protein [Candidatus Brocadiaceae bacterium]
MSTTKIKLCPKCGSEYYAHIATCADCGVPLKTPEEIEKERNNKPAVPVQPDDEWVPIREGGKEIVMELSRLLASNSFSAKIGLAPGCSTGKCGGKYLLLTTKSEAHAAHDFIEEYYTQKHPEIKTSQEWALQGKCPACGYAVSPDAKECPDCGLSLMVEHP